MAAFIGLVAAFGLAGVAALYPLRFFRLPGAAEVDRRIEAANELLHSPVLVQADRPSGRDSSFSQALWREHQKRMAARLDSLGADLPRTRVPERDPWGLRAGAALLLVTAFAFSFGPTRGRIADGFSAPCAHDAVPPRIDAWVAAGLTGKPPIFLTAMPTATPRFMPEGSDVYASPEVRARNPLPMPTRMAIRAPSTTRPGRRACRPADKPGCALEGASSPAS